MLYNHTVVLSIVLFLLILGICSLQKIYDITVREDDNTNSLITVPEEVKAPAGTHAKRIRLLCLLMSSS